MVFLTNGITFQPNDAVASPSSALNSRPQHAALVKVQHLGAKSTKLQSLESGSPDGEPRSLETTPTQGLRHCSRGSRRDIVSETAVRRDDRDLESSHLADLAAVQLLGACMTLSPEYIISDLQQPWL
jgi:hypothetical protein